MTNEFSERIWGTVREKTSDEAIKKFLEDLFYFESINPGWFKKDYRKKIKEYAKEWKVKNED